MLVLPVFTPLLRSGDDLAAFLVRSQEMHGGDILVVSSKAVATVEGAAIDLATLAVSEEAKQWAGQCGRTPAFCQAVLDEVERLHGAVIGSCPGALLTELRPEGLSRGTIFAPNAGMDESNVASGFAIGWPHDPVRSARELRSALTATIPGGGRIAVLITDSCLRPRRIGVTAFTLAVSGLDPLKSEIGKRDLFGHPLRVTVEAIADQIAVAGNSVMGNAAQSIPAAIIRDHSFALTENEGWVPGIEPTEDLFARIFPTHAR